MKLNVSVEGGRARWKNGDYHSLPYTSENARQKPSLCTVAIGQCKFCSRRFSKVWIIKSQAFPYIRNNDKEWPLSTMKNDKFSTPVSRSTQKSIENSSQGHLQTDTHDNSEWFLTPLSLSICAGDTGCHFIWLKIATEVTLNNQGTLRTPLPPDNHGRIINTGDIFMRITTNCQQSFLVLPILCSTFGS